MAKAGYLTTIRRSGTATAFTNSAFSTNSTVANTFQISSTVTRVWDRTATAPSFAATSTGGGAISSTDISSLDYLFGKVVFKSTHSSVYGTGTYLPLAQAAGANAYSMSLAGDILDNTAFADSVGSTSADLGYRTRQVGLRDVTVSITRFDNTGSTAATQRWFNAWRNTTGSSVVVIDVNPGGSTSVYARGYFRVAGIDYSGDVASLETAEVSAELDASTRADFGWSDQ